MNPEKLKKLQAQVRIGGKGTPRRKKKVYRFILKVNISLQFSRLLVCREFMNVYIFKCHLNKFMIYLLLKSVA